jgi:hypothetical protein
MAKKKKGTVALGSSCTPSSQNAEESQAVDLVGGTSEDASCNDGDPGRGVAEEKNNTSIGISMEKTRGMGLI